MQCCMLNGWNCLDPYLVSGGWIRHWDEMWARRTPWQGLGTCSPGGGTNQSVRCAECSARSMVLWEHGTGAPNWKETPSELQLECAWGDPSTEDEKEWCRNKKPFVWVPRGRKEYGTLGKPQVFHCYWSVGWWDETQREVAHRPTRKMFLGTLCNF